MSYFVIGPDGAEHGPYEVGTLIEWAKAGTLPRDAPVRSVETGETCQAVQIAALAPQFADFAQPPGPTTGKTGSVMMPSQNPNALWGYYLGWLSIVCFCGVLAAPFAIWKSARGLRAFKDDPSVFGKAHAIIGLVLGSIGLLANLFLVGLVVVNLGRPW